LYPIAYISALGTLSLLVIVFAILWIMIMREDNTFTSVRQLILPFVSGLTLALLMILSIDLFRLQLTGTWSGFPGLSG
jgi:RsiW-degrading membrane proteinase PrsW (M82 family)